MVIAAQQDIQSETLAALSQAIPPGRPVALLDYPLHRNAGDTLIYAGTIAYLAQLGVSVRYITTVGRYRPEDLRRLHPDGTILLHGGGNFGDRWGLFQAFRERVIADFPDRPIVQLPQTIEMDGSTAARVSAAYRAHPDLTVLLRDSRSMHEAATLLPGVNVAGCPDLAFGFEPTARRSARWDVVVVKRRDSESAIEDLLHPLPADVTVHRTDWKLTRAERAAWHAMKAPGAITARLPGRAPLTPAPGLASYSRISHLIIGSATRTIGAGRVVVTDRLHAAILATLMGRPVVALDNATRKVSTIFADHLHRFPEVSLAENADTATRSVLERLAALESVH